MNPGTTLGDGDDLPCGASRKDSGSPLNIARHRRPFRTRFFSCPFPGLKSRALGHRAFSTKYQARRLHQDSSAAGHNPVGLAKLRRRWFVNQITGYVVSTDPRTTGAETKFSGYAPLGIRGFSENPEGSKGCVRGEGMPRPGKNLPWKITTAWWNIIDLVGESGFYVLSGCRKNTG